jgi:hypothetical protein
LSIAVFCGTTKAQENLGTYLGKINTTVIDLPTIPAQETIVILRKPLQDPSGSIPLESNPFNLRVVATNRLRTSGEIEIDSADTLQYWWICDVNSQDNCERCYQEGYLNGPPPENQFPSEHSILGCLVDTHTAMGGLSNFLAIPVDPSFVVPTAIEKGATLTGTIDEDKKRLKLTIKGTASGKSFESEIEAKLK